MLSAATTKRIYDQLNIDYVEDQEFADINIEIDLPADLCSALEQITDLKIFKRLKRKRQRCIETAEMDYSSYFKLSYQRKHHIGIKTLIEMLDVLNHNQDMIDVLPDTQIAAIEEYRLCIMQAVYSEIDKKGRQPVRVRHYEEDIMSKFFSLVKEHWPIASAIMFGVLFVVGVVLDVLYNYAGFYEIISLVPFLPAPVLIGACITLALLNLILYIAFEGAMMADMFDIRPKAAERKKLDIWENQLELTREINERLTDTVVKSKMKEENSKGTFKLFDSLCDRMILYRQLYFGDDQVNETPGKRRARIFLICLGALLSIGSAFFSGMSMLPVLPVLLPFLAPAFATPIGPVVFIGVVVLSMLASYFAMQRKGITQLLSPNLDRRIEVGQKLDKYRDRQPEVDVTLTSVGECQMEQQVKEKAAENNNPIFNTGPRLVKPVSVEPDAVTPLSLSPSIPSY